MISAWLDTYLADFSDFYTLDGYHDYKQKLDVLERIACTSRNTREQIANWIFPLFQKNQFEHSDKCFDLFSFAVKIRHEPLCMAMLSENDELLHGFRSRMLVSSAPFTQLTPRVFAELYQTFAVSEPLPPYLFLTFYKNMIKHTDSRGNREKIQLWFRMCEQHARLHFGDGSARWVQHLFMDSNLFLDVISKNVNNASIFEELCRFYPNEILYFRDTMNALETNQAVLPGEWGNINAPMRWVSNLGANECVCDRGLLMFVLKMTNYNLRSGGDRHNWTFIHRLIINHEVVEKYTDFQLILDFLNSGQVQYNKTIQCEVSSDPYNPDVHDSELVTALELANRTRPKSTFLIGITAWLQAT